MIPVIYLNLHPKDCHPKDHWDTAIFQELILKGYEDWNGKPEDFPKAAVVMIAGRFHADDLEAINRTLGFMDGCVVVVHSDEESLFPWYGLEHPNMRLWVMTPHPATQPFGGVRFIGEGWSPGTPEILGRWIDEPRTRELSFYGQVTHERRREFLKVLDHIVIERELLGREWSVGRRYTASFAAGMDRAQYLRQMLGTKFAPCPTGPVTADSFRVYEALEAGCIPILDGIDGKGRAAWDLWALMLGEHPLPVMYDWSDLPEFLADKLPRWDTDVRIVRDWWAQRKRDWVREMADDVKAIS